MNIFTSKTFGCGSLFAKKLQLLLLIFLFLFAFFVSPSYAQAGLTFTKYPNNPIQTASTAGSWDDAFVAPGTVLYDGQTYTEWYSGGGSTSSYYYKVGLATSPDGVNWTKYSGGPVLDVGPAGSWDSFAVGEASVINDGGTYKMWYVGFKDWNSSFRIGYATSPDGIHWTKPQQNPVITTGEPGAWDDAWVSQPEVHKIGNTYYMWYVGVHAGVSKVGLATSQDGVNWAKYAQNPILDLSSQTTWGNPNSIGTPNVLFDGTTYTMFYHSDGGIGYATSYDGIHWGLSSDNPILSAGASGQFDSSFIGGAHVIQTGNSYQMWYGGLSPSNNFRIGYATGSGIPSTPPAIPTATPTVIPTSTPTPTSLPSPTPTPIPSNPVVGTITAPSDPVLINTTVNVSATFTDADISDTHTAVWAWGDTTTSQQCTPNTTECSVTESNGSGTITGSHTYTAAGVYPITLTVTDTTGRSGTQTFQYVTVYNPTPQGLFSAGQKYTSPAGALTQNTSLTGLVHFGLSYKYQGSVATGNRQFSMDYNQANFHFNATSISSLVIANGIGTLRGTGTVNGSGSYTFLVVGNENTNTIRIQIKDTAGVVLYDSEPKINGSPAPDTTNPTTLVTAGNVLAH